ncbi:lipopolysaccharide biosynthesis protein [Microbacterium sp. SLBN-111]|uniref:lipopolysaccharide biosynthesis protein n=1 Tax=Microbacterium sp. SLBN-111 TaxID=3377733 RepID=UPI003C712B7E
MTPAAGRGGHVRAHAVALAAVGVASAVGAIAAFAFHVVTARFLGAADFSLLAAFWSIVNVAAIGSSALQNSVAVETARLGAVRAAPSRFRLPLDAVVVGLAGGVLVSVLSPLLASALDANTAIVLTAAVTVPLSFLFAAYLGRIQGTGRAAATVGWSTASLVFRVVLAVPALVLGAGVGGAAGAVVAGTGLAVIGAAVSARRAPAPSRSIFTADGVTIMVITVALAWLTSSDVFFMRMLTPPDFAGAYASVAVLVKSSFILPSTLSLYLLPRFARNRGEADLTRLGVLVSLLASAAAAVAVVVVFLLIGGPLIDVLYGSAYAEAKSLLLPVAIAYVPWIVLQGLLIQLISDASRAAAVVLVIAVGVQAAVFFAFLPAMGPALIGFGVLGAVLCAVLLLTIGQRLARVRRAARENRAA